MGSKREEERNEKIIRGLMKLPPNRRCINCNSLGPQYVCTNFWTFVCMTCSGIHREFTHRVKSVSMSKFTSQEVEALQNGGNQRAREIYLKDWDQQRQRLPSNSNVDKVREFIKNVYVDKRYAGGKSADKPPRDLQRLGSHEDETRRASSYHSYSQSPPYDFQYEDRRYGKQAAVLTRKPGSDRGLYPGKMASFICSPTRLSERVLEDRFANEGSVSRFSDYSMSSGGDPVRYGPESPNFQKEIGYNSPPIQPSRDIVGANAQHQETNLFSNFKRDSDVVPRSQRTASLGSIGSFDSTSMSLKSYNSGGLVDVVSGPDVGAELHQDAASSFPPASTSVKNDSLDLFKDPGFPEPGSSATPQIDLFQLSVSSPAMPVDLFQSSPSNLAPTISLNQSSSSTPHSSIDLFGEIVKQQPVIAMDKKSTETLAPKDEGWATFDTPQNSASMPGTENLAPSLIPSGVSSVKFEQVSSVNTNTHWAAFQNSDSQMSLSISGSDLWHGNNLHIVQAATDATGAQTWNAFDNSVTHVPAEGIKQFTEPQSKAYEPFSTVDQHLGLRVSEGFHKDGIQRDASYGGFPGPSEVSEFVTRPSFAPSLHPLMEEMQSHPSDQRSTNPFDLPYESDLEQSNMFLDMSSLQGALPNAQMPSAFIGAVPQQWFPQDPLTTYLPASPQGSLAYMARQTPNPQLANVQTQGPFTSVGGNPFA